MNIFEVLRSLLLRTSQQAGWIQTLQEQQRELRADVEVTKRDIVNLRRLQARRKGAP